MTKLVLNGKDIEIDADPQMPLLYAIRDIAKLTGTKFGCGMALCGACTIHLDGNPIRACVTPLSVAEGKSITTIEGLAQDNQLHPVQKAWIDQKVPQCGYCQAGQMMSASALLAENDNPSDEDIETAAQEVLDTWNNQEKFYAFLITQPKWTAALEKHFPERYQELADARYEALDQGEQKAKQFWEQGLLELTQKALQTDPIWEILTK